MVGILQLETPPMGGPKATLRPNRPVPLKSTITTPLQIPPVPKPNHDPKARITASFEKTTVRDSDTPSWQWVSTTEQVAGLVTSLEGLPNNPPSLYIDLEGVNLGRNGTVSILQMYVLPHDRTYLIDVHTLGKRAFARDEVEENDSQGGDCYPGQPHPEHTTTLKDILESATTKKVIFDVRHDSDALYAHFGIKLAGIEDLQLMELATRGGERTHVKGLAHCIRWNIPYTEWEDGQTSIDKWLKTKEKGRKLFAPEHGGSFEVFNQRPLSEDVLQYCVEDVRMLPKLWSVYDGWLRPLWRKLVDGEVDNRIRSSQSAKFKGGWHMTLAPVGWDDVESDVESDEEQLDTTDPGVDADGWSEDYLGGEDAWDYQNYSSDDGHQEYNDPGDFDNYAPLGGYQLPNSPADAQIYWPVDGQEDYNDTCEYENYAPLDGYEGCGDFSDAQGHWPVDGYGVYIDPSGLHLYAPFDTYQSGFNDSSDSENFSSGDGYAGYDDPWKEYDFRKYLVGGTMA